MNIRLANAIVGLSVVIGVVLISSGVVFGNNPQIDPPGGGITPTFSGLNVMGNTTVSGHVNVTDYIYNSNNALKLTDNVEIKSNAEASPLTNTAALKIGSDNVNWMGIDINEIMTKGGNLLLNNDTGTLVEIGKAGTPSGLNVFGPTVDTGNLTVTGNTGVTGDLTVNGNTGVTGDLTVDGEIIIGYINSPDFGMGASEVFVNSPFFFANRIRMQDDFSTDESIHADQFISGGRSITAAENITAGGKIGKFYRYRSRLLTAAPSTNLGIYNFACPVGIATSCSVYPASVGALLGNYAGLGVAPVSDANGVYGCQPKMYNSHGVQSLSLYVYAVCFDASATALPGVYSGVEPGAAITP